MRRIRVAVGDVQSGILRDILAHITDLEPDMELVHPVGLSYQRAAVEGGRADVVMCDVRLDELPKVAQDLFGEGVRSVVVGLAREGREAAVCIANAGTAQLMSVIRSAIAGADDEAKADDDAKVVSLRATDPEQERLAAGPYVSNAECLSDQLRSLDLAILAEIDALESTIWDESVQRLQGLAISPGEVRALLDTEAARSGKRQGGDLRRRRQRLVESMQKRLAATAARQPPLPFAHAIQHFGLGPFEQLCLTAALAVEIDRNKYGKAYALLQDDVTRKQPSLELLLQLHDGAADVRRWDAVRVFDVGRPLRRWNLLRLAPRERGDPATCFGRALEIDDRISRYLLGLDDLGSPLEESTTAGPWNLEALRVLPDPETENRLVRLVADVRRAAPAAPARIVVHVHGRDGSGRRSLVAAVCQQHGLRLLRVDAGRLAALPQATLDESLVLLGRESALQPTAICFEHFDAVLDDDAPSAAALRTIARVVPAMLPFTFLIGQRAWIPDGLIGDGVFHSVAIDAPEPARARRLWEDELADGPLDDRLRADEVARELAGRFAFSPGQIHDAVSAARTRKLWEQPDAPPLSLQDLYQGCRDQCSHRLRQLARKVETSFGWDDLILPATQREQLRELEAAIRNASGVLSEWNFESRLSYGRGITALFAGPSGTGKTMAAGILARELGLELYAIDLSRVVSKYIGETEKNLDRIFQQAEEATAMLFFDEADALFGKRSAIKDAHDRYANIEVAYLLQKMEERRGATVLATNLRTNMDEAFERRIRFAIDFPLPDQAQRLEIWRRLLPDEAPLAEDVDLPALAKRLRLSGGSIKNVCMGAASLAYRPGGAIHMRHMLHAAKRELQKLGQQYDEHGFEPPALAGVSVRRAEPGA